MNTTETTALFKRVGRKYVPIAAQWYEDQGADQQKVNSFRLTYAYADGGRRYAYDVTPATAPAVAAMMIARVAMEAAICEMSKFRPSGSTPYTKKQLGLISKFRDDMGMSYPTHWTQNSAHEISEAAIKAVLEFAP